MKKIIWLIVFIFCITYLQGCGKRDVRSTYTVISSPVECDLTLPSQEESQYPMLTKSVLGPTYSRFGSTMFNHENQIYPTSSGYYVMGLLNLDEISGFNEEGLSYNLIYFDNRDRYRWSYDFSSESANRNIDLVKNAVVDSNGNIYITGTTYKISEFGERFRERSFNNHLEEKDSFVICFTPKGSILWSKLFSGLPNEQQLALNEDLFYVYRNQNDELVQCTLETSTGEILKKKMFPILQNTFDLNFKLRLTQHGFCTFINVRERVSEDINPEVSHWINYWKVQFYSYKEGFKWEKTFSFPTDKSSSIIPNTQILSLSNDTSSYGRGDIKNPILIDSNSTHCMIGFNCTYYIPNEENKQQFHLMAYTHSGDLDWIYSTGTGSELSVTHMACNEKILYMAGYTDTEFLSTNETSYQKSIVGETDVFVQALSMKKEPLWCTYLGGSNQEPYDCLRNPFTLYRLMKFSMQDNLLCVAFPTTSSNIPLFKNITAHDGKSTQEEPPANSIIAILNDQGIMQQCTYTYSEVPSAKPPIPEDEFTFFVDKVFGDYVQDIKIHQNKLYMVSTGNSPITLLTNPKQKNVSTRRFFGGYGNFFFLSKYNLYDESK